MCIHVMCMYVCMYVCMHTHVCVYAWSITHRCMHSCTYRDPLTEKHHCFEIPESLAADVWLCSQNTYIRNKSTYDSTATKTHSATAEDISKRTHLGSWQVGKNWARVDKVHETQKKTSCKKSILCEKSIYTGLIRKWIKTKSIQRCTEKTRMSRGRLLHSGRRIKGENKQRLSRASFLHTHKAIVTISSFHVHSQSTCTLTKQ